MGGVWSKISNSQGLSISASAFVVIYVLRQYYENTRNRKVEKGREKERKVVINREFFQKLYSLLKILIPGFATKEVLCLGIVTACLLARTYCDVALIKRVTTIERVIITRDSKNFFPSVMMYMVSMVPVSLVNNLLKFSLSELTRCFRRRLSTHLFSLYLKGFTSYQINNLDNRISDPDQILTQDVEKLCQSITELYSNISKPLVDVVVYSYKLTHMIGAQGPTSMLSYLALSSSVLMMLRAPLGKMTVEEQELEGRFRYVNSRLITNSEEIAFYQGSEREKDVVEGVFEQLIEQVRKTHQFRFALGTLEQIIGKYFATVVGFYVVSRPFMDLSTPRFMDVSKDILIEEYYQSGRMLLNLAQAVGRLVLAGRELTRLSGFTARMSDLMCVLQDLNEGKYHRTMLSNSIINQNEEKKKEHEDKEEKREVKEISWRGRGKIITEDFVIELKDVPLVTPNGDILIEKLSFRVEKGMNVIVCGPNGCGKSSLFRILGELWPLFGGVLTKPAMDKLFYIPQRPYMMIGTLREQITYPDPPPQQKKKGKEEDEELKKLLEQVHLGYLLERHGLDAEQDWMDVLSGGEKQRLAMARLFYHKPQFAILDECTSAVSTDVEGFMYNHCQELGITLFTVSHRRSLWAHHEFVLRFTGRGDYSFEKIGQETERWGS